MNAKEARARSKQISLDEARLYEAIQHEIRVASTAGLRKIAYSNLQAFDYDDYIPVKVVLEEEGFKVNLGFHPSRDAHHVLEAKW